MNFGQETDRFKHEAFKSSTFYDKNEAGDAKKILQAIQQDSDDSIYKNIEKKIAPGMRDKKIFFNNR